MKPPHILVDDVRDIARGRPGAKKADIKVRFASGVEARLDTRQDRDRTWVEVLESRRETGQPAYVEIDPETRWITSLLLPREFTVTAIRDAEADALEIELEISHARHYLRRDHPRFAEMHKILEDARRKKMPVLVTESLDGTAIIDVRVWQSHGKGRR